MSETTRILIVEDGSADPGFGEREIRQVLPRSEFLRVATGEGFLAAMGAFRPDLILSETALQHLDGLTALRLAQARLPDVPFLILTAANNEDAAIACMNAGAWDYVLREAPKRLGPAVCRALEQKRLRLEQARAEAALRESDQRFVDLLHASHDAILLLDGETFVDCNKAALRMLGFTDRAQLLRMRPSDLSPPTQPDGRSSDEKARETIRAAMAQGFHRFEWIHRRADNQDIPVEVSLTPINYQGRTMLHCLWRDISSQTKAEQTLRESERLLRATQRLAKVGGWEWERDTQTMTWTEEVYRIHGVAPGQVTPAFPEPLGKTWSYYASEHRDTLVEAFQQCLEHGDPFDLEFPLTPLHGRQLWVRITAAAVRLEDRVVRIVGNIMDITDRKGAEMALRAALETTERIINTVPFAVVLVGKDGTIRRANRAAGKVLNSIPSNLVGRRWSNFVPDSPDGNSRTVAETNAQDAEGAPLHLFVSVIPAFVAGEDVCITAFLDLTERRNLEAQLRHAQKLEAVGQLAAGIAHEINTPAQFVGDSVHFLADSFREVLALLDKYRAVAQALAALPGHADVIRELQEAEATADLPYIQENATPAFNRALDGIARISTIVSAMKEFAHPDVREKAPADLNRAVQATITIARNEYKYVADVETELGDIPPVVCHISDLNQVFLNLLVNAAHAISDVVGKSGEKGIIRVRTALEGKMVRIDIADTGCGIPEAIRERIFDPFFTTKEVGRGSGQGLALARSIVVAKHGGSLTFESEVGRGTTFTVRLPIEGGAESADNPQDF